MKDKLVLANEVVHLRPVVPADAELIHEAVLESIEEISPWMFWCHPGYSLAESKTWADGRPEAWEKGDGYDFVIEDTTGGPPVGICGLNHLNTIERVANLGYWIRTSRARQGIASAAVPLVARFGFEDLKLNRIEIVVATDNHKSQKVAEKIGAVREGVLRRRLMVRETVYDAVMFSFVPEDFD